MGNLIEKWQNVNIALLLISDANEKGESLKG